MTENFKMAAQSRKPLPREGPSVAAQAMCPWGWTGSRVVGYESKRGLGLVNFLTDLALTEMGRLVGQVWLEDWR